MNQVCCATLLRQHFRQLQTGYEFYMFYKSYRRLQRPAKSTPSAESFDGSQAVDEVVMLKMSCQCSALDMSIQWLPWIEEAIFRLYQPSRNTVNKPIRQNYLSITFFSETEMMCFSE